MGDYGIGRTVFTDPGGQRPRVDAGQADNAARLQPAVKMLGGAIIGWLGNVGLEDHADRAVPGGRRQVFNIFFIGADIADMGEGESDNLAEIAGISQDFLIAGQGRVEANFRLNASCCANALAFDDGAIGQHKKSGRFGGCPCGCRGHIHPVRRARPEMGGANCFACQGARIKRGCVAEVPKSVASAGK